MLINYRIFLVGKYRYSSSGKIKSCIFKKLLINYINFMSKYLSFVKEELFDSIFTYANIGLAIVSLEGQWIKVNQSIVNLLGYSEAELLDMSYPSITHREDLQKDLDSMNELINGEIDSYQTEKRFFHKDGNVIWALVSVSLITDELNEPLYYVVQVTDITSQRETTWQLNLLMNIVKEQNKKLLNFAHIATHDIRTHVGNLGSIIGFIEDDFETINSNENFGMLKESLSNLESTLDHLNNIRKSKLDQTSKLKSLSLYNYVTHAIYNINSIAKKYHCQILNHVDKGHNVLAIEAYLDSIILNFLTNAIKYRSANRLPVITISSELTEECVILKIEDNGLGINLEKDGNKLFTLNGTFHDHKDSRGVGLYITKNHVESIGGKIEVESEVGQGTSFSIYFKKAQS